MLHPSLPEQLLWERRPFESQRTKIKTAKECQQVGLTLFQRFVRRRNRRNTELPLSTKKKKKKSKRFDKHCYFLLFHFVFCCGSKKIYKNYHSARSVTAGKF
jgi:hypothetical protein